jgi:hypothetical protein
MPILGEDFMLPSMDGVNPPLIVLLIMGREFGIVIVLASFWEGENEVEDRGDGVPSCVVSLCMRLISVYAGWLCMFCIGAIIGADVIGWRFEGTKLCMW